MLGYILLLLAFAAALIFHLATTTSHEIGFWTALALIGMVIALAGVLREATRED